MKKFDEKYDLTPYNQNKFAELVLDRVEIYPMIEGGIDGVLSKDREPFLVDDISGDWNSLTIEGTNYIVHFHPRDH